MHWVTKVDNKDFLRKECIAISPWVPERNRAGWGGCNVKGAFDPSKRTHIPLSTRSNKCIIKEKWRMLALFRTLSYWALRFSVSCPTPLREKDRKPLPLPLECPLPINLRHQSKHLLELGLSPRFFQWVSSEQKVMWSPQLIEAPLQNQPIFYIM